MFNFKFSKNLYIILTLVLAGFVFFIFASAQEECSTKEECEALLEQLEQQIIKYEKDITKTEQEKKTLQNRIYSLRRQIEKLDLQISEGNIRIKDLSLQISDLEKSIQESKQKIKKNNRRLVEILRILYKESQKSTLEILLSSAKLSDFFENIMALERLHLENKNLLASTKNLKQYLTGQKESLEENKESVQRLVKLQILQKQEKAEAKQNQEYLLGLTETQYQQQLKAKQEIEKRAAEIRARIFELIGVPKAPTFGQAVEIAKSVQALTGIRPAFLLAVLHQESNIGKNVGQCNLVDTKTGRSASIRTGQIFNNGIHPTRDLPPFLQITNELGRDPLKTPISCPIPSVGGYGGAMGPAQFIPSTWMIYKDRIAQLKNATPDPWNIKDAFLAAAVYLRDAGAARSTYKSEWCAAIAYFSGSCSSINQRRYRFYADSVMAIAEQFEKDIAVISR